MNWHSHKLGLFLNLGVGLMLVYLVYQVSIQYRVRIDMTEENRYSISEPTRHLLERLDRDVLIEIYLAGEMPSNFIRFQKAIRELLDEFSVYSNVAFDYKFIDPAQAESQRARDQFFQGLINIGLQPSSINYTRDGNTSQKYIFPGAIISYGDQELAVNLLKGDRTAGVDAIINQSIEGLEYELANALQQLTTSGRKKVGLVTGHNEPDSTQLAGLINIVLHKYDLFKVNLPTRNAPITGYDLLLITKPTSPFSEREKYLLDQYVMRGGSIAFFVDALRVNMDRASGEGTVAIPYETNLQDLLFKYGVRVNQNFAVDLNCGDFPVVSGNVGNQPQIRMLPWPYFPVISNFGNHPAVKNLDAVLVRFASTLDTVKAEGIKKSPLLKTSGNSKVLGAPITVAFNDLQSDLIPERFQSGPQTLGYLLEGTFSSLYENRFPPEGFDRTSIISEGEPNKLVVIADGDMIRNELSLEDGKPLALGVDPYSQMSYANESLVINLIDYLLDEDGLIDTRSKELKIRPLDKVQVRQERTLWQVVNLVLPIVVLLAFGLIKWGIRKKRYRN